MKKTTLDLLSVFLALPSCGSMLPSSSSSSSASSATAVQQAQCIELDESRLVWKGIGVAGGAMAAAASSATALVGGLADAADANDWAIGLGIAAAVAGGVGLLGGLMESSTGTDFATQCGSLWMPAEPELTLTPPESLPSDEPSAALPPEAVPETTEASGPAEVDVMLSDDLPGPEGTGTGADGLTPDELEASP